MCWFLVRSLHIGLINYDETPWLISSVGITNALGRILCGFLSNFRWVNVVILHFAALIFGATLNISVTFFESKIAAFLYAVLYGFVLGMFFFGLMKIKLIQLIQIRFKLKSISILF